MILVDTNLLCRLAHRGHPDSHTSRNALHRLRARGNAPVIVPQNLYEFWSTATRPAGPPPTGSNGLGMSISMTNRWMDYFQLRLTVLPESTDLLPQWRKLVTDHRIAGSKCHDARLVAAMLNHGIPELLTFNVQHFKQFSTIRVIHPQSVA